MEVKGAMPKELKTFFTSALPGVEKTVKALLVVEAPFTSYPIISPIIDYIIHKVCELVFTNLETQTEFIFIDKKTAKELSDYVEAVTALRANPVSENFEKAKESLAKLVTWHGSNRL